MSENAAAPMSAPIGRRTPKVTTRTSQNSDVNGEKFLSYPTLPWCMATMAPPMPATNAETAKAITRPRAGEMPIDCAATSLPRRARRVRPVLLCPNRVTPAPTRASATRARTRKARSPSRSHGPITGRGTICDALLSFVPPTQANLIITESKKKANASVAMAIQMPLSRSSGRESRAPTAAAMSAPMRAP